MSFNTYSFTPISIKGYAWRVLLTIVILFFLAALGGDWFSSIIF